MHTADPIMLDVFLASYIECALWSSMDNSRDDGGDPLDDNYGPDDIDAETLAKMREECADFIKAQAHLLSDPRISASQAGHDFWLNRNGHGAGFWDHGSGELGTALSDACDPYGSCDLYVGDDGKIYC